jgi:hypothetical protein
MASRKMVFAVLGIAIAALLTATLLLGPDRPPIAVQVVGFEPAGIFDDSGEMWVVTVRAYNPSGSRGGPIYIKAQKSASRVANLWSPLKDTLGDCAIYGFNQHELQFVVPPKTDRCRISLQWTYSHLKSGRLWWLAERMTLFPRVRSLLWKRTRGHFPVYAPNSYWRKFNAELSLPPGIVQPKQ